MAAELSGKCARVFSFILTCQCTARPVYSTSTAALLVYYDNNRMVHSVDILEASSRFKYRCHSITMRCRHEHRQVKNKSALVG